MRCLTAALAGLLAISLLPLEAQAQPCVDSDTCSTQPSPSEIKRRAAAARAEKAELERQSKAEAARRAERLRQQQQAAQERERADKRAREQAAATSCGERFKAMLVNEGNESPMTFQTFSQSCPANAMGADGVQLQQRLAARAKLKGELVKWGLTERELCGLAPLELLAKSMPQRTQSTLNSAADAGDSVAMFLWSWQNMYYYFEHGNEKYNAESEKYLRFSSLAGNPAAMAEQGRREFNKYPTPNLVDADGLLKKSREMQCGRASYYLAYRIYKFGSLPTSLQGLTSVAMTEEALQRGVGQVACDKVSTQGTSLTILQRQDLFKKADETGAKCGDILRLYEGDPARNGVAAFGPCAINYSACLKIELEKLRDKRAYGAGWMLAQIQMADLEVNPAVTSVSEIASNLFAESRNGDAHSMAMMGMLFYSGKYGQKILPDLGKTWCQRSYSLGGNTGAVCLALFGGAGATYIDQAAKSGKCFPYNTALWILPDGAKAKDVRSSILKLSTEQRSRLRSSFPMIQYAIKVAADSNESCAVGAKAWLVALPSIFSPSI